MAAGASLGSVILLVLGRGGKWFFFDHLSKALLFFSILLLLRRRSSTRFFRHPAVLGGLGLGLWYTLAGFLSPSPVAAWSGVSSLWSILVLVYVGVSTWREFERRFLEWLFAGAAVLQTILLIVGRLRGVDPILIFPGNSQYASFLFCAVVFLALARVFPAGDRLVPVLTRVGWAGVSFAGIGGLFLLPVRSGLLALLVGALVFGATRFGSRGVIGVGCLLIVCFSVLSKSQISQRLKLDDPRAFKRTDIWRASLAGLGERPLLGWGPGQFENLYWRHGLPQDSEPVRFEMTTDRAHNEFLQYLVESGIPGGLFALLAFFGFFILEPGGARVPGLKAAWASLGAFAMVNSPFALPACGALVGCLGAFASPSRFVIGPRVPSRPPRWILIVALFFFSLMGLGESALAFNEGLGVHRLVLLDSTSPARLEARRLRADQKLHSGMKNGAAEAEKEFKELLRWNPQRAELWRDGGHLKADHGSPVDLNEALADYRHALVLAPHKAPWWMETAQIYARAGDRKSARWALAQAIRNEPFYFDAWLGVGILLHLDGRSGEGLNWLRTLKTQSVSWPLAQSEDSGYRKMILHQDQPGLDKILQEWVP